MSEVYLTLELHDNLKDGEEIVCSEINSTQKLNFDVLIRTNKGRILHVRKGKKQLLDLYNDV